MLAGTGTQLSFSQKYFDRKKCFLFNALFQEQRITIPKEIYKWRKLTKTPIPSGILAAS